MNTKTLVVGQKVSVFGCGFFDGAVIRATPDGVGVQSDGGFAQFDKGGKETEDSLVISTAVAVLAFSIGLKTTEPGAEVAAATKLAAANESDSMRSFLVFGFSSLTCMRVLLGGGF